MTLDDFLENHTDANNKKAINAKLTVLRNYSDAGKTKANNGSMQMVENLKVESRLSEDVWRKLCEVLLGSTDDAKEIYNVVVRWGRQYVLWLKCAKADLNTIYAHCVPLKRFCERKAVRRNGVDAKAFERQMEHLLGKTFLEQRARLAKYRLGDHQMWATFAHDAPTDDPMNFLPNNSQSLCAWLGLEVKPKERRMLVFRYKLADNIFACVPTVATAAASHPWNENWRAVNNVCHGWTKPWDDDPEAQPCPEIVHAPVKGSELIMEILSPE